MGITIIEPGLIPAEDIEQLIRTIQGEDEGGSSSRRSSRRPTSRRGRSRR